MAAACGPPPHPVSPAPQDSRPTPSPIAPIDDRSPIAEPEPSPDLESDSDAASIAKPPTLTPTAPVVAPIVDPPGDNVVAPATDPTSETIRLGSWNVRRLGHGTKRLDLVARLIAAEFDAVAIQEVMHPDGVGALLALLPGWKASTSAHAVGTAGYAEYYTVVYNPKKLRVTAARLLDDPADEFVREPYVVCLAARFIDFCVVSIHVVYGKTVGPRDAEIRALGRRAVALRAATTEKDWILVGDFNRPDGSKAWIDLAQQGFVLAFRDQPTTLGKSGYVNAYDHALTTPAHTTELRSAGSIDFVKTLCAGVFAQCAKDVSDHAPILVRLTSSHDDD